MPASSGNALEKHNAEIELSALATRGFDRQIAARETPTREARIKLKRLYPPIERG